MKVKKDFVTNSSSVSFLFHNKFTTSEVALLILDYLLKVQSIYCRKKKIKKILLFLQSNKDMDCNLILPFTGTNPTFIYVIFDGEKEYKCLETGREYPTFLLLTSSNQKVEEFTEFSRRLLFLDLSDFKMKTREEFERKFLE